MCLSGSAIKIRARSLPLFSISLALKVEKARGPGDMDGKKVGMISPGEMHDGLPTHICGFRPRLVLISRVTYKSPDL
jgi:hypothetical protein